MRRAASGRPLRLAHLTTVDMSLALLLGTELRVDVERGFDVFGISAPGRYVGDIEALGVRHVALSALTRSWDLRHDVQAARQLLATLRRLRPDVLHTHTPKAGVLGRLLGRAAGVPVIVNTCHGLWLKGGDSWAKRAVVLAAEALAARASDAELYQNGEDRQALRRAVPARRSRVVGNGVDLDRFHPDSRQGEALRAELGVPSDALLVGGVGRRVAEKGLREYAATARALAGKAEFVWVGPNDEGKPDALAAEEPGVRFLGSRPDMPAVYSALDLFVLGSYREGFSRSAMEAAACGTAMVLSDIRGCREIGEPERELLLVPPADDTALTAAVSRLLTEAPLRERLGAAARNRALACFDQRRVAEMSLATYAAIARRKRLGWREGRPG
jgi:glycosyltransferase involved in cell wall biosynthesis